REVPGRQFAQRRITLAVGLLAPPGDAAAVAAQLHGVLDGRTTVGEILRQRSAQPMTLPVLELLPGQAARADAFKQFDGCQHGSSSCPSGRHAKSRRRLRRKIERGLSTPNGRSDWPAGQKCINM